MRKVFKSRCSLWNRPDISLPRSKTLRVTFRTEQIVRIFIRRAWVCSYETVTLHSAWQHYLQYKFETWQVSTSWSLQTKKQRCDARGPSPFTSRFENSTLGYQPDFSFLQVIQNWEGRFYKPPSNFRNTRRSDNALDIIEIQGSYLPQCYVNIMHRNTTIVLLLGFILIWTETKK
jgi:hypothetical protein